MRLGIDVGSTTLKCVLVDENDNIVFSRYKYHHSQISKVASEILFEMIEEMGNQKVSVGISGSAGIGMAQKMELAFTQEVYATRKAVLKKMPETSCVIELGGEDAKILFLKGNLEVRMNGSCAGGTGAFIDQMTNLLAIKQNEMDKIASQSQNCYTIASRCGVFAKTDVQALISQGAGKSDIAYSVFQSVVNQTITGLAQGRRIEGNVVYLGGPLTFFSTLRSCFDLTLKVNGKCPENSLYYVALGAAFLSEGSFTLEEINEKFKNYYSDENYKSLKPLFETEEDKKEFFSRHDKEIIPVGNPLDYEGKAYLGVDVGSTTVKVCIISEKGELLFSGYRKNEGDPIVFVKDYIVDFLTKYPKIELQKGCSTGYGEKLVKNAFNLEYSIVETQAHLMSAQYFYPDVDFIIDIGGQDIKCFKISNGIIDDIFLNEACSSGCGSFLQTFFSALGYSEKEASRLALESKHPVNLGSRCTVFMNSSVKQAQKDGAKIEDIFSGLAISVVKNALYKVIRCNNPSSLGKRIIVQGGTFLNNAVLRAFENELKLNVIRPDKAGLMGAYGCALYAKERDLKQKEEKTLLDLEGLKNFTHTTKATVCKGCLNHCQLTINTFSGNRKFISGNKCDKFASPERYIKDPSAFDIYSFKQEYLTALKPIKGKRGKIGIPFGLNFWELLPFWFTFFTELGYEVVVSKPSTRETYLKGQMTVTSDTICYPAKLLHGHIQELIDDGVKTIFYNSSSYNIDEKKGTNHFNCPIVAYYPEVLKNNMKELDSGEVVFIKDMVALTYKNQFKKRIFKIMNQYGKFNKLEIKKASEKAYEAYDKYIEAIRKQGDLIIKNAREKNLPIMVLVGRPYHVDKEVNHGVDQLILQLGCAVLSEDSIAYKIGKQERNVLNQWTYHARMYDAARYACTQKDMSVIQLVSFGCGLDAVTSDELREIVNSNSKIYTQLKIDEIAALGAVKIRVRSLLAALGESNNE